MRQIPRALLERFMDTLCYAASLDTVELRRVRRGLRFFSAVRRYATSFGPQYHGTGSLPLDMRMTIA